VSIRGQIECPFMALSVISLLRGKSIAFGWEADMRTVDRSNQSDVNDPKPSFIRQSSCKRRPDNSCPCNGVEQPTNISPYDILRPGPTRAASGPNFRVKN